MPEGRAMTAQSLQHLSRHVCWRRRRNSILGLVVALSVAVPALAASSRVDAGPKTKVVKSTTKPPAAPVPAPKKVQSSSSSQPPAAPPVSSARSRLAKGRVVLNVRKMKGFGVPKIITEAVVDAPAAAVFALLTDCRNLRSLVTAVDKVKVLSLTPTKHRCWMHVDTPFPFSDLESTLEYTKRVTPTRRTMSFKMTKGDYSRNRGKWTLTPFDTAGKQTLVRYELHCIPNTRAPNSAITWGTKRNIRDMFGRLRKMTKRAGQQRLPR